MLTTDHGRKLFVLILALLALGGCSGRPHSQPNVELIQNMMEMPNYKAQEADRVPPEGSIPRDHYPYPYDDSEAGRSASGQLQNPLPRTMQVMRRGETLYNTYCIVCHGNRGDGNGPVAGAGKFPLPPTLHSDKARDWRDGRIFHVITMGQNIMPSYAAQISSVDRWAIIHYVRALQRASNPTSSDLKEFTQGEK